MKVCPDASDRERFTTAGGGAVMLLRFPGMALPCKQAFAARRHDVLTLHVDTYYFDNDMICSDATTGGTSSLLQAVL